MKRMVLFWAFFGGFSRLFRDVKRLERILNPA